MSWARGSRADRCAGGSRVDLLRAVCCPSCLLDLPDSPARFHGGGVPVPTPGPCKWHLTGKWVLKEASGYDAVTLYSSGVSMGGSQAQTRTGTTAM